MYIAKKQYLLKSSIKTLMKDLELKAQNISEFYTVAKVCKTIKFSNIDNNYYKTTQLGIIGSIVEKRKKIKKSKFKEHSKDSIGLQIIRKSFILPNDNEQYRVDIYQKDLKELYILEISFKNKKDFREFVLPELFKDYIVKEVSKDERYQHKNLALLGDPKKNIYNIYAIFKDLELGRTITLDETIFKEMKSSDAVRIALFRLFVQLKLNQDIITASEAKEGLKEFESNLKKSSILIKQYKTIFDKNIVSKVKTHLKVMLKALKVYKDLDFIEGELESIKVLLDEEQMQKIYTTIKEKKEIERKKISRFFNTREFAIIFKQYELLLRENNKSFLSIDAQMSIEKSIQDKVLIQYKKTMMECEKYEGCEDEKSYKSIKKTFNTLKTLLQEFDMVIDDPKYKDMYKSTKEVTKNLQSLKNINKKRMIIDTYLENLTNKPLNYHELKKRVEKESKHAIEKKKATLEKKIISFKDKKDLFI